MEALKQYIISTQKWKLVLANFALLIIIQQCKKQLKNLKVRRTWRYYENVAKQTIQKRKEKIYQFLSKYGDSVTKEHQEFILNCSVIELIENMNKFKITSEQIVIAYSIRICQIGIEKNYIADVDFEQAIAEAQQKDQIRKESQGVGLPPLHGLPIGIKDHLPVKGLLCTMGLASRSIKTQEKDCTYVAALRRLGAVFLCMTTCPQFSLHFTTESHLWGRAFNPYKNEFSTGGSSGGSAGSIATRCLPIAIGSDLAGSIRLPSAFCGVYSFKPSNLRVSKRGVMSAQVDGDLSSDRDTGTGLGPIGRNTDDLKLICQNIFGQFIEDPIKNPMPWDNELYENFNTKQMNIGFVGDCPAFPFVAPVKNSMDEVIQELKNRGHNMIPFNFDQFFELDIVAKRLMMAKDIGKIMEKGLQGEKPMAWVTQMQKFFQIPLCLKYLLAYYLRKSGNDWLSKGVDMKTNLPYSEACDLQKQFDQIAYKFFDYWRSLKIDILILPIAQYFTLKHGEDTIGAVPSYLYITNSLKMPAGTVPIRLATQQEAFYDYQKENNNRNILTKAVNKTVINCDGLPISIQIATLPFEDEKCLKGMKVIEEIFKFSKFCNE